MPAPRLVHLPPELADPVRRRNGGPPEPEPDDDELDLEPDWQHGDDPWITVAWTGLVAIVGLVGLGVWKLAELIARAL